MICRHNIVEVNCDICRTIPAKTVKNINLTFGVFNKAFIRTEISVNCQYELHHFEGQLVVTDGIHCLTLDDYWAKTSEIILMQMFDNMAELTTRFPDLPPRIDWFVTDKQPITWGESYADVILKVKPQPTHGVICYSSPIPDTVAN